MGYTCQVATAHRLVSLQIRFLTWHYADHLSLSALCPPLDGVVPFLHHPVTLPCGHTFLPRISTYLYLLLLISTPICHTRSSPPSNDNTSKGSIYGLVLCAPYLHANGTAPSLPLFRSGLTSTSTWTIRAPCIPASSSSRTTQGAHGAETLPSGVLYLSSSNGVTGLFCGTTFAIARCAKRSYRAGRDG